MLKNNFDLHTENIQVIPCILISENFIVFFVNAPQIHFIAIGGSAMHNLAIALHKAGYKVTGSDDEINEPSRTRLARQGLLPAAEGWFPEKNISSHLDAVILGMHARADNPELFRAQQLGLKIYSYPEYLYEHSKSKQRVVIGGSHGKTTITSMIMHVLKHCNIEFDYMVGAQLDGFDTMVRLSSASKIFIAEGDEYLSSPIDRRPKFHLYKADIGLISGIAWDHINVFPTFENYLEQFRIFAYGIPVTGSLIYFDGDDEIKKIVSSGQCVAKKIPYSVPAFRNDGSSVLLVTEAGSEFPLHVFGRHNLANMEGARKVCEQTGVTADDFYKAISSFKGAAKRLELIARSKNTVVYKDFAHAPSKLKATIEAVKAQYPQLALTACMELHTFSSLSENFLGQYQHTMDKADEAIVYFNPHTVEHKKLKPVTSGQILAAFGNKKLKVFSDSQQMKNYLLEKNWENKSLLLMSSGNFDGLDLDGIGKTVAGEHS